MENNTIDLDWIQPDWDTSSTTCNFAEWSTPTLIKTQEVGETVEMLYKETSFFTYAVHPSPPPEEKVFKIIYSCKDGKWHKSERIYGKIIPAQEERYEFTD